MALSNQEREAAIRDCIDPLLQLKDALLQRGGLPMESLLAEFET